MKTVTIKAMTFGNFDYDCVAQYDEAHETKLVEAGIVWVAQRKPSSRAEKALAGYEKRPTGFKRNSIAFTEENAAAFPQEFGGVYEVADGVSVTLRAENVREHVVASSEPQYKAARKELAELESRENFLDEVVPRIVAAGAKVGVMVPTDGDGDVVTHDESGEFSPEFVKAYLARVAEVKASAI